jgi:hypothetical protein
MSKEALYYYSYGAYHLSNYTFCNSLLTVFTTKLRTSGEFNCCISLRDDVYNFFSQMGLYGEWCKILCTTHVWEARDFPPVHPHLSAISHFILVCTHPFTNEIQLTHILKNELTLKCAELQLTPDTGVT